jgi:hypothetical protein
MSLRCDSGVTWAGKSTQLVESFIFKRIIILKDMACHPKKNQPFCKQHLRQQHPPATIRHHLPSQASQAAGIRRQLQTLRDDQLQSFNALGAGDPGDRVMS